MTLNQTHSFTLFLAGANVLTDAAANALFAAGCDDAVFGERDGAQYAAFDREAASFREALVGALEAITNAVPGVRVVRIEPDDLVTMAAIAERTQVSREYVRLLMHGERGPGAFPPPVAYVDDRTRLWQWPAVAEWFNEHELARTQIDAEAAELAAALNATWDLLAHTERLKSREDRELVARELGWSALGRGRGRRRRAREPA